MKTPPITKVCAEEDYILRVWFGNGAAKKFDMKPLLAMPVYRPLQDKTMFGNVSIDQFGGITWGNDIDCCRDTLYAEGIPEHER